MAYQFFVQNINGIAICIFLGAVVLAITGAEALYSDMGHFGRKPIQTFLVLNCFSMLYLLNYYGQGALLIS